MAQLVHALVIVVLAVLVCCRTSKGAPSSTLAPVTLRHDEIGDCLWGTRVRRRCQDCAVYMKSSKAYRMCCFDDPGNSTESVRAYCERLLDYSPPTSVVWSQTLVGASALIKATVDQG